MHYVGILDGADKTWGIRIPDLPGCHGGGKTPDAALADAISAAREHGAHLVANGIALPKARTIGELLKDKTAAPQPGESLVMVPLLLDSGRSVRANVSLDAGILEAIDKAAAERGLTRSAFLASAARAKIAAQ